PELLLLFAGKPVLIARLQPDAPKLSGPQLAFAGIAKPWRFERSLREAGVGLSDFAPFPDHAAFTERGLTFLAAGGAALLTTEKDWARLPADWRGRVTPWPVRARFEDEAALDALLLP